MQIMETHARTARVMARDDAMQTLNRLTTGVAIGAIAGVGVLAVVSASTIPGTSSASQSTNSSSLAASTSSSSSIYSPFQPSSGVGSTSGTGIVVSGGSH